jgi:activating signal cointegrator 1
MKAITLHQPYATLLAHGFKLYETRSWLTRYRGQLAIHASKQWTRSQMAFTDRLVAEHPALADYLLYEWEFGYVVATCTLTAIHPTEMVRDTITPLVYALGDYRDNRYAWQCIQMERITPVKTSGKQGLWNWAA